MGGNPVPSPRMRHVEERIHGQEPRFNKTSRRSKTIHAEPAEAKSYIGQISLVFIGSRHPKQQKR